MTNTKFHFPPSAFKKREDELFEDYTAVTDWERFTQDLENILTRWGLNADGDHLLSQLLLSTSTPISNGYCCGLLEYGNREFALVYHSASVAHETASLSPETPYQNLPASTAVVFNGSVAAPLSWFGLHHALILRPVYGDITGHTRLNQLLSSVEMVVHSTRCPLPILVEYAEDPVQYYGVAAIPPSSSTNQDVYLLDRTKLAYTASQLTGALNVDFATCCFPAASDGILPTCTHLSGLRECFLAKLGYPWKVSCPSPEIHISARFIYKMTEFPAATCFSSRTFPIFSFNAAAISSVSVRIYFSAVWNEVPSHAITEKPSPRFLQPEGASEWRFQALIRCICPDNLSLLIGHLLRWASNSEADMPELVTRSWQNKVYTSLASRVSWLGADLPRLKNTLASRSLRALPNVHMATPPLQLTGEIVLNYLLFLFPDADPNFSCSDTLALELSTLSDLESEGLSEFDWKRINVRLSPEIKALAIHLGLPPLTSLSHRLSVLLANLHCREISHKVVGNETKAESADCQGLVHILLAEFLLELQLRLDRGISLPPSSFYTDAELAAAGNVEERDPKVLSRHVLALVDMSVLHRSQITVVDQQSETLKMHFSEWSDAQCLDLNAVLLRFDHCVSPQVRSSQDLKDDPSSTEAENVEEEFFDADDNLTTGIVGSDSGSTDFSSVATSLDKNQPGAQESIEEARSILAWLRSLDCSHLLCLLLPSTCLESLIIFHSLVPHPRLAPWYYREVDRLDCDVHATLSRLSVEREGLDGYESYRERFCETYSSALRLLANFGKRIACFNEMLHMCIKNTDSCASLSDTVLSFLCDLSSRACSDVEPKHLRWRPHLPGWLSVPRSLVPELHTFWQLFQPMTSPSDEPPTPLQMIAGIPVECRQPRWETYTLCSNMARPHPLASRPGPQQLLVELGYNPTAGRYDHLLMAGAFSHDTQFF